MTAFKIFGHRYRIVDRERFAEFLGMIGCAVMVIAAFLFFFGCCWGGFLRW